MNRIMYAAMGWAMFGLASLVHADGTAAGYRGEATRADRSVEVTMGDMYYEPKSIDIKAGETVRFVLVNRGHLEHEFTLGDEVSQTAHRKAMLAMLAQHGADHASMADMHHADANSVTVAPGKTGELTWTFGQASNLEFACNVPGHYEAGMVGHFSVVK